MKTTKETTKIIKTIVGNDEERGTRFIIKITDKKIEWAEMEDPDYRCKLLGDNILDFIYFMYSTISRLKKEGEIDE
jgi:hypothetical protein